MTTAIVRATLDDVPQRVAEALALIGYQPHKDAIFIKPNVPDYGPPDQGLYTDPRVVEGLLQAFSGHSVVIGEGGIIGRDMGKAFQRTGYAELARRYGAELVDLNEVERMKVEWEFGQLELPVLLRTHEYINVAKMKTHVQTGVTLGLKNQKGLLLPADKRRFHRRDLNACIAALGQAVQPALTVIDGIIALEGDGPWRYGTPKPMGLLVAGENIVEVDNVCLRVMGFPPEHAPHIPVCQTMNVVGLSIEEVTQPFAFGYRGYFRYKNVYEYITDSCSGCNWTLYYTTRLIKASWWRRLKFLYRGTWRRLDIVMGHAHELTGLPAGHGKVVCVGDCARKYAAQHGLPIARGCPPTPEDVVRLL